MKTLGRQDNYRILNIVRRNERSLGNDWEMRIIIEERKPRERINCPLGRESIVNLYPADLACKVVPVATGQPEDSEPHSAQEPS